MKNFAAVSTIYVSNKIGDDFNSGIRFDTTEVGNGPVKTIERALKIACGMRVGGYMQPLSVKLMDEMYELEKPIEIGEFSTYGYNGGARCFDVCIEAFHPNKKPLISGAKRISGFTKDTFNGVECFSVFLPEVKAGKWDFKDLYVNGMPASRTRYPDEGFLLPEAVEVELDPENETSKTHSKWFVIKEGDLTEAIEKEILNASIRFSHYWLSEIMGIEGYDSKTRKCTLDAYTRLSVSAKPDHAATMQYYFENLACCFKNKGEWYLEKESGKLYYIPLDGQTAEELVVYAPMAESLVNINGGLKGEKTRGVTFKNIIFAYTKSDHTPYFEQVDENGAVVKLPTGADVQAAVGLRGAINFKNATACTVDSCEIFCVGTYGVKAYGGCDHIKVVNTQIHDCLGGGVSGGENGSSGLDDYVSDLVVRNCHLYNLGLKYYGAIGVLIIRGYNCVIENNDIHDLEYSGISVGWSWGFADTHIENIRIAFNRVYNIGKGHLSDMGGIYILGKQKGTVVSNNIVHDVKGRNYGAIGLYADEGCSSALFEKNIVYNVKDCFHIHFGSQNVVRNNIFAFPQRAAITMNKSFPYMKFIAEYNIMLLSGDSAAYGAWGARCPYATSMYSDWNVIYHLDGKEALFATSVFGETDFQEGKKLTGWDENTVFSDPLFKDAKNFDFTLDKESPAFALGFEAIDVSKIGCEDR